MELLRRVELRYIGPNRKNASGESRKFYRMDIEYHPEPLSKKFALNRAWGRIGASGGQGKLELYETEGEAFSSMSEILECKISEGYRMTLHENYRLSQDRSALNTDSIRGPSSSPSLSKQKKPKEVDPAARHGLDIKPSDIDLMF